ncbi:synaptonemal complex protein 1 [Polymixia lowei]
MERDRGFNFKLLVPPRVNTGQISAVRPREVVEDCDDFMHPLQQGYNKCFDKEPSKPFPNTSGVVPTKTTRQDVPKKRVVPPMEKEENICNPGQLCSKLFDEVEKIKCWKVKIDSESVQRERRLHENKRTIETQRKAIQDLQFGNESLSIKLEEQISENEDLTNKNNATRNLCNLLKDTFQRSAEKMHLFESEREETHHLFMENNNSIQRMIAAFENLRIQAEVDQHEMQKVKEGLLQFEDLKEKYEEEYNMKQEEVDILQAKLKNEENELQKILLNLHETQESCKQLQEAKNQHYELLLSSKNEQDSLLQKLLTAEQLRKETEKKWEAIATALEQSKEEYAQMILKKDSSLKELNKLKDQQADKLVEIQATLDELQTSLTSEIQTALELELKLTATNKELERKTTVLGEIMDQSAKKDGQIKILVDELDIKSKSIESLMGQIEVTEVRVQELTAELSRKNEEVQLLKIQVTQMEGQLSTQMKKNEASTFQMEQLKKDILQHEVKYEELLSTFNELQSEKKVIQEQIESGSSEAKTLEAKLKHEDLQEEIIKKDKQIKAVETKLCNLKTRFEAKSKAQEECHKEIKNLKEDSKNIQRLNKEEHQKLLEDLGSKTDFAVELQSDVQKLKLAASEAIKNKDDAELKCQHKIADMVVLMEKHKSQYDRMVEEKDAELDQNKKKEMEAVARKTSLELEVSQTKIENDRLTKQLKKGVTERSPESNSKELRCLETPKEASIKRHVFDFSKTRKTPSHSKNYGRAATAKINEPETENINPPLGNTPNRGGATSRAKEIQNEDPRAPSWSTTNRAGTTPKIKSYRIRTPPSIEKSAPWRKGTLELDPKSDSSEHNDLLTFANASEPGVVAPQRKLNIFKTMQSPAIHKSPGNFLKMAAIKRMRDAGWTTVSGSDKKKRIAEKIFA